MIICNLLVLRLICVFQVFLIHFLTIFDISIDSFNFSPLYPWLQGYVGFGSLILLSGYLFSKSPLLFLPCKYNSFPASSFFALSFKLLALRYFRLLPAIFISLLIASCLPLNIISGPLNFLAGFVFFTPFNHSLFHPLGVTWTLPYDFSGILFACICITIFRYFPVSFHISKQNLSLFYYFIVPFFVVFSYLSGFRLSYLFLLGFILGLPERFPSSFSTFIFAPSSVSGFLSRVSFVPSSRFLLFFSPLLLIFPDRDTGLFLSLFLFLIFFALPSLSIKSLPRLRLLNSSQFLVILLHYPFLELISSFVTVPVAYFFPYLVVFFVFIVLICLCLHIFLERPLSSVIDSYVKDTLIPS